MTEGNNRRLLFHGMCLFLLGLLTGFAEQHFANVRMGLAAHLEGVMNGIFLVGLGAIWNDVRLSRPIKSIAYWTALGVSAKHVGKALNPPPNSEKPK